MTRTRIGDGLGLAYGVVQPADLRPGLQGARIMPIRAFGRCCFHVRSGRHRDLEELVGPRPVEGLTLPLHGLRFRVLDFERHDAGVAEDIRPDGSSQFFATSRFLKNKGPGQSRGPTDGKKTINILRPPGRRSDS
jgi:hypothetical protein